MVLLASNSGVECYRDMVEVAGSNPVWPTRPPANRRGLDRKKIMAYSYRFHNDPNEYVIRGDPLDVKGVFADEAAVSITIKYEDGSSIEIFR